MSSQQLEFGKMNEEFMKKVETEQLARKNLEALILKERKEAEKKVKEAEAQIDNISMNFQMAVASKTTAESKVNALTEQKKVLVKEVKQLRKRQEELQASNDEMKALNDRLMKAAAALQLQIKSSSPSPKTIPSEKDLSLAQEEEEGVTGQAQPSSPGELNDLLTLTDKLIHKSQQVNSTEETRSKSSESNADDGHNRNHSDSSANPLSRAMNTLFRSNGSEPDLLHHQGERNNSQDRHSSDDGNQKSRNDSMADEYPEERPSWEMPPMALRELGWLSDEQSKLMEKRLGDNDHNNWGSATPGGFKKNVEDGEADHSRRGSTLSMFSGVTKAIIGGGSSATNSPSAASAHSTSDPSTVSPQSQGNRRSSLMSITSMFMKEKPLTPALQVDSEKSNSTASTASTANPSKATDDSLLFFSSPFNSSTDDEADRLPSSMRLHCLRCKGTVEGPKFSTCKCSTPALTPDDLSNDRISALTGMLSKGSSAMAGGLWKATSLISTTHTPTPAGHINPTSSPSGNPNSEINL